MMETFIVPALCLQIQSVLALFKSNQNYWNCGGMWGMESKHSVPVFNGLCYPHATFRLDLT